MLSCFSRVRPFATLWTAAHQATLSVGFSRKNYWSGLPFPIPGDLPNPGIKPTSLASPALAGGFFTTSTTWEALNLPYDPEIPLLGIYLEKATILKDTCTPSVRCSTIYSSQDMEAI